MKNTIAKITFLGLIFSSFANMQAKKIDQEDLQQISANKLENSALRNGQMIIGSIATTAAILTLVCGCHAIINPPLRKAYIGGAAFCGLSTAGLLTAYFKILKKRMQRHGYDSILKFMMVDLLSQHHK